MDFFKTSHFWSKKHSVLYTQNIKNRSFLALFAPKNTDDKKLYFLDKNPLENFDFLDIFITSLSWSKRILFCPEYQKNDLFWLVLLREDKVWTNPFQNFYIFFLQKPWTNPFGKGVLESILVNPDYQKTILFGLVCPGFIPLIPLQKVSMESCLRLTGN